MQVWDVSCCSIVYIIKDMYDGGVTSVRCSSLVVEISVTLGLHQAIF